MGVSQIKSGVFENAIFLSEDNVFMEYVYIFSVVHSKEADVETLLSASFLHNENKYLYDLIWGTKNGVIEEMSGMQ